MDFTWFRRGAVKARFLANGSASRGHRPVMRPYSSRSGRGLLFAGLTLLGTTGCAARACAPEAVTPMQLSRIETLQERNPDYAFTVTAAGRLVARQLRASPLAMDVRPELERFLGANADVLEVVVDDAHARITSSPLHVHVEPFGVSRVRAIDARLSSGAVVIEWIERAG